MRTLATLAPLVVLSALTTQANHYLAPLQVHLFLGGLYVAFAALRAPRASILWGLLLAGLWLDATSPVTFGTHAALLAVAYLVIQRLRERLPRDETFVAVLVALFANLGLFLALSFHLIGNSPVPSATWLRHFVDLLFSQIVVAAIAPWFFALQGSTLRFARLDPAT